MKFNFEVSRVDCILPQFYFQNATFRIFELLHIRASIRTSVVTKVYSQTCLKGHPREGQKWLLMTGDPLIQVYLHYILVQGTQKRLLLKTGDLLVEVTS